MRLFRFLPSVLPPSVLQLVGIVGIILLTIVWFFTDRAEASIFAVFGTLTGVGLGAEAVAQLNAPEPAPAPADRQEEVRDDEGSDVGARDDTRVRRVRVRRTGG